MSDLFAPHFIVPVVMVLLTFFLWREFRRF